MTQEEQSKENTEMTYSGTIKFWRKEPVRSDGRYYTAFCIDETWYETPNAPKETIEALPKNFPRGTSIKFETVIMKCRGKDRQVVKIGSIEKIVDPSKPDQTTIEQSAEKSEKEPEKELNKSDISPKLEPTPKKDMKTVNRYQWNEKRGRHLNMLIIQASDTIKESGVSLEEQPEKIAEFAEKLDKALQERFPELRMPE